MKLKLKEIVHKIRTSLSPYKRNLIDPLIKIILIIIVCVLIVKFMTGGETLLEYAQNK